MIEIKVEQGYQLPQLIPYREGKRMWQDFSQLLKRKYGRASITEEDYVLEEKYESERGKPRFYDVSLPFCVRQEFSHEVDLSLVNNFYSHLVGEEITVSDPNGYLKLIFVKTTHFKTKKEAEEAIK